MKILTRTYNFPWNLFIIFLSAFVILTIIGFYYYNNQRNLIKNNKINELVSISNLKAQQIVNWRNERLGDAKSIYSNESIILDINDLFKKKNNREIQKRIKKWIKTLQLHYFYSSAILLDSGLNQFLINNQDTEKLDKFTLKLASESQNSDKIIFSDFHFNNNNKIELDIIIPLQIKNQSGSKKAGVIILTIDPNRFLYPLIQSWPVPSRSSETLLLRREGNDVLYLNELKYKKNTALRLRLPVSLEKLPAAMAARGITGIAEGLDYRGMAVLVDIFKIPDSPWFMITKVDEKEVFEQARSVSIYYLIIFILLFTSFISLIIIFWRRQNVSQLRKLYQSELDRKALEKHFEYLVKYANDIIILYDNNLNIIEANERAFEIYQFNRDEFLELNLKDIRLKGLTDEFDPIEYKLAAQRGSLFETIHLKKDGSQFPVEVSARTINIDDVEYYQNIIRDITERKKAEKIIDESNQRSNAILNATTESIWMFGLDGEILLCNNVAANRIGYKSEEILGRNWIELIPHDVAEFRQKKIEEVIQTAEPVRLEDERNGIIFDHNFYPVLDTKGKVYAVASYSKDISERKKAEHALIDSQKQLMETYNLLETVTNGTEVIVSTIDNDYNYTFFNEAYRVELLRLTGKEITIGSNMSDILSEMPEQRDIALYHWSKTLKGEPKQDSYLVEFGDTGIYKRTYSVRQTAIRDAMNNIIGAGEIAFDVTDQIRAEKALHESEERFKALFQGLPVSTVVFQNQGDDFIIKDYNHASVDLTKGSMPEFVGKSANELYGSHPDILELFSKTWTNKATQKIQKPYKMLSTNEDIYLNMTLAYIPPDSIIMHSENVSDEINSKLALEKVNEELDNRVKERTNELDKAMIALEAERRRFRDVLDSLPASVVLLTNDYHVPFANKYYEETFGKSNGRRCYEYIFCRTEPCENCETFTVMKTGNPHHWEWTGPNGKNYEITDFPFTDTDGTKLVLKMGIDVTDRNIAENKLQKYQEHLEELVKERTHQLEAANNNLQDEIAERKKAESALIIEQKNLQTIFDSVNVGLLLINQLGEVKRVNNVISRWFGREIVANMVTKPGDLVGCIHALTFPGGCGLSPHCAFCPIRNTFESVLKTHQPLHDVVTETTVLLDGNEVKLWLEVSADPVYIDDEWHVILALNNITLRKIAENKLEIQHGVLNAVIESSEEPIFSVDRNFCYTMFNTSHAKVMKSIFGKEINIGANILDYHSDNESRANAMLSLNRVFSGESFIIESYSGEDRFERRYFQISHNPIRNLDGEVVGAAVYSQDLTERKKREDELNRLNRTLKALSDSNQAIMRANEEIPYLNEVCEIIVKDCGHALAWIGLANEDRNKSVLPVAYAGYEDGYLDSLNITWSDTLRGQGPTGMSIRTGEIVICRDILKDPKFKPWRKEAIKRGYASSISLPLKDKDRTFGALMIYSTEPDPFSDDEVKLLSELANDLAYGITSIRLRLAHAEAVELLKNSEERYRNLFEQMTEGFALHEIVCDENGKPVNYRFLEVNPAFEKLTGLKKKDLIGKLMYDVLPNEDPIWVQRYGEVALTGNPVHFENYSPELKHYYEVFSYSPIVGQFAVIFNDVTEKRKAELALIESENNYRSLAKMSPVGIFRTDNSSNITYMNTKLFTMAGISLEEGMGIGWQKSIHHDDFSYVMEEWLKCSGQGIPFKMQFRLIQPSGNIVWTFTESEPMFDSKGDMIGYVGTVTDITELKNYESILSETKNYLENLINYANAPIIVWDHNFQITRFNHAFEVLTGRTSQDVIGKSIDILFPTDKIDECLDEIVKTYTGERMESMELPIRNIDGSVKTVLWNSANIFDESNEKIIATIAQGQDITMRINIMKELMESEKLFRLFYTEVPLSYQALDIEDRFIDVNPAWVNTFGYLKTEVVGKLFKDFLTPKYQKIYEETCTKIKSSGEIRGVEFEMLCKDGRTIITLFDGKIGLDDEGNFKQTYCVLSDITLRKQAEEKIKRLNEELEQKVKFRTANLEAANKELEAFSYSVSHDLRAPLRAIDGFSRILSNEFKDKINPETDRLINIIRNNAQKMGQLIDDILNFSRIGRQEMAEAEIDMKMLTKEVYIEIAKIDDIANITFDFQDMPSARADKNMMKRVIENLLRNAIKFTRTKPLRNIKIGGYVENDENIYYIEDNGVGFDMKYVDKLFNVFQRLHTADEFEGTGVGMAIVKRIIQRHGGRVWAVGEENIGATIYFTLPITTGLMNE
jgi:PAS domain S-box-containing protein